MKRRWLDAVSAIVLVAGSLAACDAVPEARAHELRVALAESPVAQAQAVEPVVPVPGQPVLWGYVDGAGIAHFANRQVDGRYAQVLRETDGPRVPGKTQGTDGLLTWLDIAPDVKALQPVLDEAARATGVDAALLKAVIVVESNYDPRAVSRRGAVGLMQLRPVAADRYGTAEERRVPAARRLLDARTNVLTGARMLADLTRRYGDVAIALAAWNAGEGTVRQAGGQLPDIAETEAHVHLVLELYWALLQRQLPQHAHGIEMAS